MPGIIDKPQLPGAPSERAARSVSPSQRFSRKRPCPICKGVPDAPRGAGRRCWGFYSTAGEYAHCVREEHAGALPVEPAAGTYAHRLRGDCACGIEHGEPAERPRVEHQAAKTTAPRTVAEFSYTDEHGELLFQVVRQEPKHFFQRAPDGKGGWRRSLEGVRRVLYRLVALLGAPRDAWVVLVEGEGKADRVARELALVSTCAPGGAGKWSPDYTEVLRGRRVLILPDNDEVGRAHATRVRGELERVAAEVAILELPGLPPKGDVADWLNQGGTRQQFAALLGVAERGYAGPEPVLVPFSEIAPEAVTWLWDGRIPVGKLTLLDGDPGLGKSTLTMDFASRVSTGTAFPTDLGRRAPSDVVVLSFEDGAGDTLRPRLDAAGADPARVHLLLGFRKLGEVVAPILPADMRAVEECCARVRASLVIIDPFLAYLGGEVDAHRDQDVRRALAPLAALAERQSVAVVVVRHLNKAGGASAIYRGGGSIGIIGAARSGLLVAKDPDDPDARVLASVKNNLAREPASLSFRMEQAPAGTTSGPVARIAWIGESSHRADDLLQAPADPEERSATSDAQAFLKELLEAGPVKVEEIRKQAANAMISDRVLRRARERLHVVPSKHGFTSGACWVWALPDSEAPEPAPSTFTTKPNPMAAAPGREEGEL